MEIKVSKEVEEVLSIDLPYYCKSDITYFKIISQTEVLSVGVHAREICLNGYSMGNAIRHMANKVTEDEFTSIYFQIQGQLNAKLI